MIFYELVTKSLHDTRRWEGAAQTSWRSSRTGTRGGSRSADADLSGVRGAIEAGSMAQDRLRPNGETRPEGERRVICGGLSETSDSSAQQPRR